MRATLGNKTGSDHWNTSRRGGRAPCYFDAMGTRFERAGLAGTGLDPAALAELEERATDAAPALADAGFCLDLDRARDLPGRAEGVDRVVVLGIGGSALGARCVHQAARTDAHIPLTAVDNIDPDALNAAWAGGDPARTAWVAVSKSGGTAETLGQLAVVRARLREAGAAPRIYAVTGPSGALRELAERNGFPAFDVPEDVGGRFSVFTPAATVPLALAGHDVGALLAGARAARDHCAAGGAAARLAALLCGAEQAGRNVVTLWAYAERLASVGEWFRQLWAESLGKIRPDGVRVGQTPVHCVGSTDQHSIQQLMVEGPRDKVAIVLAGPATGSARVPEAGAPGEPAAWAGAGAGHELAEILDAMRRATSAEMVAAGCPLVTATLDSWGEGDVARLLMTFLCATVLAGELLGVDPYGQPGVEAAKQATQKLLAEPDGAEARAVRDRLAGGGAESL